jgi:hypothetical protein
MATRMPAQAQSIQAGKNAPKREKEGAPSNKTVLQNAGGY